MAGSECSVTPIGGLVKAARMQLSEKTGEGYMTVQPDKSEPLLDRNGSIRSRFAPMNVMSSGFSHDLSRVCDSRSQWRGFTVSEIVSKTNGWEYARGRGKVGNVFTGVRGIYTNHNYLHYSSLRGRFRPSPPNRNASASRFSIGRDPQRALKRALVFGRAPNRSNKRQLARYPVTTPALSR